MIEWLVRCLADWVGGSMDDLFHVHVWEERLDCLSKQTGIRWS
jgi:hypothetical protein